MSVSTNYITDVRIDDNASPDITNLTLSVMVYKYAKAHHAVTFRYVGGVLVCKQFQFLQFSHQKFMASDDGLFFSTFWIYKLYVIPALMINPINYPYASVRLSSQVEM